jgi:hypothetical protein
MWQEWSTLEWKWPNRTDAYLMKIAQRVDRLRDLVAKMFTKGAVLAEIPIESELLTAKELGKFDPSLTPKPETESEKAERRKAEMEENKRINLAMAGVKLPQKS